MNSTSDIVASCLAALRSGGRKELDGLVGRAEGLMASPGAGAEVARLVGEEVEGADVLLEMALDTARMAREDRRSWGDAFVESVEGWIAARDVAGDMPDAARIGLSRAFTRAGLALPPGLALKVDDDGLIVGVAEADATPRVSLIDSLTDLRRDVGDDPLALHQGVHELLAIMPPEARGFFVDRIVETGDPVLLAAATYWLLDTDIGMRRGAAEAFERAAEAGPLPSPARLALVRPWLPADAAREALDRAIRAAMRRGGGAPPPAAWQVGEAWASLPDGSGASSIAVAVRQGRRRAVAMVLLKLGHGVKDAYVVPRRNARDQAELIELMSAEVEMLAVPPAHVAEALAEALGEGQAAGALPAPGLIDVAEILGLGALVPQARSVAAIVAGIDPTMSVRRLSAAKVAKVVKASREFDIEDTWMETSEALDAIFESAGSDEEVLEAIHASIEARRDWWARLLARAATVMAAVDDPDWIAAAVTAELLADGGDPRDLPIMAEIAEFSLFGEDGVDAALDALPPREPPEPEREGELAGFLADGELTPDWIDGFVMAAAVAPDLVSPGDWLGCLFEAMGLVEGDDRVDRLIAIVMARYNAVAAPQNETTLAAAFAGRPDAVAQAWLAGFADFVASFRDAWRPGIVPKADRSVLRQIQGAGAGRADDLAKLEAALPRWLAGRYAGRR